MPVARTLDLWLRTRKVVEEEEMKEEEDCFLFHLWHFQGRTEFPWKKFCLQIERSPPYAAQLTLFTSKAKLLPQTRDNTMSNPQNPHHRHF